MSDCPATWTPGSTFMFIAGLVLLFAFTGVLDIIETWARRRK